MVGCAVESKQGLMLERCEAIILHGAIVIVVSCIDQMGEGRVSA